MAPRSKALTVKPDGALKLDDKTSGLMAVAIALSKSRAVPMSYIDKPDEIFSTIQLGSEFGLKPMTSLNNISNINGKPTMSIHMLIGLCQKHPEYAGHEILKSTKKEAEVVVYRKSKILEKILTFRNSFTLEEAAEAGLIKAKGAWETYSRNMCKARALAFAFRDAFADVISGTYTAEEMDSELYAKEVFAEQTHDEAIESERAVFEKPERENITKQKPSKTPIRTTSPIRNAPQNKITPKRK